MLFEFVNGFGEKLFAVRSCGVRHTLCGTVLTAKRLWLRFEIQIASAFFGLVLISFSTSF